MNEANDNVMILSWLKGLLNCTQMNEWRFCDGFFHVSKGGVSSNNLSISKSFLMNEWMVGVDTLPYVELKCLVATPWLLVNEWNEISNIPWWLMLRIDVILKKEDTSAWVEVGYLVATSRDGCFPVNRGGMSSRYPPIL